MFPYLAVFFFRAKQGELGIIPGSMGVKSYIGMPSVIALLRSCFLPLFSARVGQSREF